MSNSLSDLQRVFLLVVWLVAFGIIVVLGLDARGRAVGGELAEIWRLFVPLVAGGLITLMVHVSNQIK